MASSSYWLDPEEEASAVREKAKAEKAAETRQLLATMLRQLENLESQCGRLRAMAVDLLDNVDRLITEKQS